MSPRRVSASIPGTRSSTQATGASVSDVSGGWSADGRGAEPAARRARASYGSTKPWPWARRFATAGVVHLVALQRLVAHHEQRRSRLARPGPRARSGASSATEPGHPATLAARPDAPVGTRGPRVPFAVPSIADDEPASLGGTCRPRAQASRAPTSTGRRPATGRPAVARPGDRLRRRPVRFLPRSPSSPRARSSCGGCSRASPGATRTARTPHRQPLVLRGRQDARPRRRLRQPADLVQPGPPLRADRRPPARLPAVPRRGVVPRDRHTPRRAAADVRARCDHRARSSGLAARDLAGDRAGLDRSRASRRSTRTSGSTTPPSCRRRRTRCSSRSSCSLAMRCWRATEPTGESRCSAGGSRSPRSDPLRGARPLSRSACCRCCCRFATCRGPSACADSGSPRSSRVVDHRAVGRLQQPAREVRRSRSRSSPVPGSR